MRTAYIEPAHLCHLWSRKKQDFLNVYGIKNKQGNKNLKTHQSQKKQDKRPGWPASPVPPQVAQALRGGPGRPGWVRRRPMLGAPQQGHQRGRAPRLRAVLSRLRRCCWVGTEHGPTAGHPHTALSTQPTPQMYLPRPQSQPLKQTPS